MFMGGDARTIASQCRISETFVEAHIKGGEGVVWVGGDNGLWNPGTAHLAYYKFKTLVHNLVAILVLLKLLVFNAGMYYFFVKQSVSKICSTF
jgi:hypothetical protein